MPTKKYPLSKKMLYYHILASETEKLVVKMSEPRGIFRRVNMRDLNAAIKEDAEARANLWCAVYEKYPELKGMDLTCTPLEVVIKK